MRKFLRITGVVTLSLLYCIAAGVASNSSAISHFSLSEEISDSSEVYFSEVSDNLFCPVTRTESSITTSGEDRAQVNETHFSPVSAVLRLTEQYYFNQFTQYRFYADNLLIHFRKADQIFPFHYHW